MSRAPSVTLVGGGVATLMLGVELRSRRPDLAVTLFTADTPTHAGGHLASWNDRGYPIEHGFHALFDFYDTALALLERHGLSDRFVRGPEHFFVYERGELHRVRHGIASALCPATLSERAKGVFALPALQRALSSVSHGDLQAIAALDAEDFRGALLRLGAGESFVESSTVRMFYDFGFVGDRELSAAVGFDVVGQLLRGGRMRHFTGPSRPTLIDPLRERFVALGGTLVDRSLVTRIRMEREIARSIIVRTDGGPPVEHAVDELVLGLAVESFKRLEWEGHRPAFASDTQKLEGAESLSLQAWFDEDPVPEHIDSVLGALPEPWSTVCPQTRVRRERRGPHGFELIACGPATGFEHASDESLVARFFDTIARLGFRVPKGAAKGEGVHTVLRRNRASAERYLLTRPGELWLRPTPVTSVANVSLVGAWLRNRFTMPSVEAAAQSVLSARDAIESRHPRAAIAGVASLEPRASAASAWDLVPDPPYRHDGTTRLFAVDVDPAALASRIPPGLELAPGFASKILWFATRYDDAYSLVDPAGARHRASELMLAAVVRERGRWTRPPGLFPVALYIDSDVAMTVGREVYGFAKRFATLALDDESLTVERPIALAHGQELYTERRLLVRARWRRGDQPQAIDTSANANRWIASALATIVDAGGGVRLYNQSRAVSAKGLAAPLVRRALTCTAAFDVRIGPATPLEAMVAEVVASRTDPIYTLLPRGATRFTATRGAEFALGFSIDSCEEIGRDES